MNTPMQIEPSRHDGPLDVLPGEERLLPDWKQKWQQKCAEIEGKRPVRGDGPEARPAGMGSAGPDLRGTGSRDTAPGGAAQSAVDGSRRPDGTRSAHCRPGAPHGGPMPSAIGGHPGDPAIPTEPPCSAPGLHSHSFQLTQEPLPFAGARRPA
jgi:hypothetical protein